MVKGLISLKIAKINGQIQKLADEDDPPKRIIGFAAPTYNEEEEDIDENV